MADLDAPLVQEILDIAQRQREADVEHHRQTDDLGAGLEVAKRRAFGHALRLAGRPARGNQSSSDNTHQLIIPSNLRSDWAMLGIREKFSSCSLHKFSNPAGE